MPRRRRNARSSSLSPTDDHCQSPDDIPAPQRNAANARERARMRVLSRAFCRLKTTLPWVPADTKLSKLDTLRLATSYIAHLKAALSTDQVQQDDQGMVVGTHPINLTWPFTLQHCTTLLPTGAGRDTSSREGDSECSVPSPLSDLGVVQEPPSIPCAEHPDFGQFLCHEQSYINHGWQCH